jgi:hypothetical protein
MNRSEKWQVPIFAGDILGNHTNYQGQCRRTAAELRPDLPGKQVRSKHRRRKWTEVHAALFPTTGTHAMSPRAARERYSCWGVPPHTATDYMVTGALCSRSRRSDHAGSRKGNQLILGPPPRIHFGGTPPYTAESVLPSLVCPISRAIWLSAAP